MAFPSAISPARGFDQAKDFARAVKDDATNIRSISAGGTLNSRHLLDCLTRLAGYREQFIIIAAIPGLAAYAQAQVNDGSFNIATEFNTMRGALDNVVSWVRTNFPKDGSGFLLAQTLDANGRTVDRVFDRQYQRAICTGYRTSSA